MKAALKRKWVAALRSGKYQQTDTYLYRPAETLTWMDGAGKDVVEKNPAAHCCLGVLRHCVTAKNHGSDADHDNKVLCRAFLRRVELSGDQQDDLVEMNDSGKSFKRIATWIEKNL